MSIEEREKKRQQVFDKLKPIADAMNVALDYIIEDGREYLVCNNQKICTSCTSIVGIEQEFFGYLFLKVWRERSLGAFDRQTRNYIKQYWYDDNFKQPWLKW